MPLNEKTCRLTSITHKHPQKEEGQGKTKRYNTHCGGGEGGVERCIIIVGAFLRVDQVVRGKHVWLLGVCFYTPYVPGKVVVEDDK